MTATFSTQAKQSDTHARISDICGIQASRFVQAIFSTISGGLLLIFDCFIIYIALYFISSLDILLDCIRSLDDSSTLQKEKDLLLYIHFYHLKIIRNLRLFSNLLYYVFVIHLVTNPIFFFLTFYMIQQWDNFLFVYVLTSAMYFQFGILCVFGQMIFSKTEIIFTELYLTKWYEFSKDSQKMLKMMMIVSQRPFGFKAAEMYDINLMMFVNVVKLAFSFCAILYTFL
ncbi:odorant receptor 4-like [Phlebotomus argentipes]|uniref:odorant receptor 4-like n=1 Tax=Phlebotomus argentipes TaxID=94469 RepID=UPI00289333C4|nr:odorant receptor 4-like [Phlebotomus argentipes]